MKNSETGKLGEESVCVYLTERGYRIAARNYRIKGGEIDIIAENGDYILIGKGGTEFDREKCLMITAISDNRRGSLPHWRLECE